MSQMPHICTQSLTRPAKEFQNQWPRSSTSAQHLVQLQERGSEIATSSHKSVRSFATPMFASRPHSQSSYTSFWRYGISKELVNLSCYQFWFYLQLSKLCGDLVTEDQCWDYLATHVAPLTISQKDLGVQVPPVEVGVMQHFFEEVATRASSIAQKEMHKVAKYK